MRVSLVELILNYLTKTSDCISLNEFVLNYLTKTSVGGTSRFQSIILLFLRTQDQNLGTFKPRQKNCDGTCTSLMNQNYAA